MALKFQLVFIDISSLLRKASYDCSNNLVIESKFIYTMVKKVKRVPLNVVVNVNKKGSKNKEEIHRSLTLEVK